MVKRNKPAARCGNRAVKGQAILELVVAVPLLLTLVALAVDVGRFVMVSTMAQSAAASVARLVEAEPATTHAQAEAYVEEQYPALAGGVSVELGWQAEEMRPYTHRISDPRTGSFKEREANVAKRECSVSVSVQGAWVTPGMMAASSMAGEDGRFNARGHALAALDMTYEEWDA